MARFQRITVIVLAIVSSLAASAGDGGDGLRQYLPRIHGAIRPRYEHTLTGDGGGGRFAVRNARLILSGDIGPDIDWFAQADLCMRGEIKPLDFWGRLKIARGLRVQAGQFRMPFGIEPFRAPVNYVFANRSFIGRYMCNYRAVGAKLSYALPRVPIEIEGGVFNRYTIADHSTWSSKAAYAARATMRHKEWLASAGIMSIIPDAVRSNLYDLSVGWQSARCEIAAEYMRQLYTGHAFAAANAWNVFASYRFDINAGIFNRLSVQARFDAMSRHSNTVAGADGHLTANQPSMQRFTAGATLTHFRSATLFVDLRLNYEKYLNATDAYPDIIVAEMTFRF